MCILDGVCEMCVQYVCLCVCVCELRGMRNEGRETKDKLQEVSCKQTGAFLGSYPTKPASSSMMCVFGFRRVCVPYSQHGVFGISFIALPASMRPSFPHSIYLYLS